MSQTAPRTFPLEDLKDPGLVQRREEISFLNESLDETRRKGLRFALLVGAEGMGKSALLSSFVEKIAPEEGGEGEGDGRGGERGGKSADPSVFEVDCRLSSDTPFAPILALLARIFRRHGRTTKAALAGEGTGFDMDMIEFTIGQLREDGAEDLFAQIASDDATLFRGIGEFLARHGRARTMVLALENLQDIGGKSAAFLEGFLRSPQAADSHLLWLGLYRGDNQVGENEFQKVLPRLRRQKFFREIALSALKMPGVEAMLSGMIGSIADWRRVVSQFQDATQGNPLQIREMVENLVKKGKVVSRGDRWAIEAAPEDLAALPEAMEERLVARLPGLGKPHLDLLSWCAVAKRPVPSALAEQVAGLPPNRIVYLWNDLVKDQYLREVKKEGRVGYAFASARVREKVYGNLSEKDRAKRHLAVARGLETLHARDLGPVAPELVEHFALGENPKKEKSYAMLSGETLLARGDATPAVEMFERALSLLGAKGDRQEKRAARLALGRAFLLLDDAETARGHFEAARGDSNGPEMAECLEGMGETFLHQRRFEKAAQCFEDARKHLSKKDSPVSLDVSLASAHLEKHLFRRAVETLAPYAEPPDAAGPRTVARFLLVRGAARERMGEIEAGLADLASCQERLSQAPDAFLSARAGLEMLRILVESGRAAEAKELYRELRPAVESVDSRLVAFERLLLSGRLALALGSASLAKERLVEARKFASEKLSDRDRYRAEVSLALFLAHSEQADPAAKLARSAEQGYDQLGDAWGKAWASRVLGLAHAAGKKMEEADRSLREAATCFRELGSETELARALVDRARIANRAGRRQECESVLADALEIARRIGDPGTQGLALREEALRYHAAGARMGARQALEESVEVLESCGWTVEAKKSRAYLDKIQGAKRKG